MKVIEWLAALTAVISLAGCATVNKEPVTGTAAGPIATKNSDAVRQLPSAYRLVNSVDRNRSDGKLFFLIRNGEQWSVSFDADEFNRTGGERLMYWPEGKKIAFVFDRVETSNICGNADRDRKKRGYLVCTSSFRIKDSSGVTVFARVLVGVVTGGASELISAGQGTQFERVNAEDALAVVDRLDIDRQFWLKDYRQSASVGTVTGLNDFIHRYESDDPDHLLIMAKGALDVLGKNTKILDEAERTTPKMAQYKQRYLPANPQKYCNGLKSNTEDFKYCLSESPGIVSALADKRAAVARRLNLCQAVSLAFASGVQPSVCQQYSIESCRATTAQGQRVCDILNHKGQI